MRRQALVSLILLFFLFLGGNLLFMLSLFPYAALNDISVTSLMDILAQGGLGDPGLLRYSLLMQSICQFILPALAFAWLRYRRNSVDALDLRPFPVVSKAGLGILFLVASYPLVNLAFMANQALPVEGWMQDLEQQAADILQQILTFDSPGQFLFSLLVIAILPALGEELIFRGILQTQIGKLVHPVAAIWIAALIFSAAHFQFEGFLPRLALGAVLGYLYYWTSNLWVPILVHFFNNGVQVVALYFLDLDLSSAASDPASAVSPLSLVLGIAVMYLCSERLRPDPLPGLGRRSRIPDKTGNTE